jgi:hypothetical protein
LSRKYLQTLARLAPFILYAIIFYQNFPLSGKNLTVYGATREYYLMLGCLLLIGMILVWPNGFENNVPPKDKNLSHYWLISFSILFCVMLTLAVYVNPHGRFPWNPYPFTTTAAHNQKITIFDKVDSPPELVVLGSSHVYTVSAEYISDVTGKSAFNMSVGGAGPVDELALGRYVIDNSREAPLLFVVEMVATDLDTSAWQYSMPLNLITYLPNKDRAPVLKSIFLDTLSMKSLTDSLFLITNQDVAENISFLPDGTGVRSKTRDYALNVKKQIPSVYERNTCIRLDEDGKQAIEELVAIAQAHKISLVFYRSPLNIEFFEHVDLNNPNYKKCQVLLSEYMLSITESNPNVFYVDLIHYDPVSLLREKGYVDVQHLTPEASILVIDALLPTIDTGLKWVMNSRSQ